MIFEIHIDFCVKLGKEDAFKKVKRDERDDMRFQIRGNSMITFKITKKHYQRKITINI